MVWKRVLQIAILAAVVAAGSAIWLMATPSINPPHSAGSWTISGVPDCAKSVPGEYRAWQGIGSARRVCRAEYSGSPRMLLTLFEMPGWSGATAFDAWQKWHSQPGKLGFYKGRYFGVVESASATRELLDQFTVAVEKALPAGSEGRW